MFEIIGHILPVRSRSERFKQNKLCFGGFSCMAVCLSVRLSEVFVCACRGRTLRKVRFMLLCGYVHELRREESAHHPAVTGYIYVI